MQEGGWVEGFVLHFSLAGRKRWGWVLGFDGLRGLVPLVGILFFGGFKGRWER